ncbi:outer membrane receptor for ferrienterochelin and colicins [Desulfobotulus alkaliphilus]|uniref:Outer membrane receptor for ferrienterochelin and colicins n=1 Tax=Desulfobotulus alkaliphilus TaxID=622671 RepID=A0A562RZ85_9BACT|nr:TonB-dependent receptor [Desulfobotulus alkaliphilus]TWI74183.1 outer membrane receptor for ferrienterochelin and colicins [Desulfobotulus alkaliphilus]
MHCSSLKKTFFPFLAAGLLALPAHAFHPPESELEQIVVSASRSEQRVEDAISQVHVITAADIEARQIKNVQGLLRDIPGVQIRQNTGSWGNGGNVQLMGMNPDQTLILVDGQRFTGGHGSVDISSIPVENIERIEIVKGPGSALYGSDAMAGVIHIITKKAGTGTDFRTGLSAGSRNRSLATAGMSTGNENMGLRLDYSRSRTTGVDKDEDTMENETLAASLDYRPTERFSLRIQPFFSRQTNEVTGEANRIQERSRLNASADIRPDALSKLQVRGSYFSHDHKKKDKSFDSVSTLHEFETAYSRMVGLHTLSAGYAYTGESIDDKHKNYTKDSQDTHAVFLQDEMDFGRLSLTVGGRVDHHDEWGTEAHPRAGLLFRATDNLRFRASAGTAFMAPTLLKLYADGWRMGPWTMHANPDLKPEKSLSYQAGMDYQIHESLLVRAGLFRNEIDDLVETLRNTQARTMTYRNISEALTQGAETSIIWRPVSSFAATLGYTWTDTENKDTGKKLLDRPEHRATLDLDYHLARPDLRFRLTTAWTGEREYEEQMAQHGQTLTIRKTRSAYTMVDLAITHHVTKNLEIFTRLENLTNEKDVSDEPDIDGTEWMAGMNFRF